MKVKINKLEWETITSNRTWQHGNYVIERSYLMNVPLNIYRVGVTDDGKNYNIVGEEFSSFEMASNFVETEIAKT